MSPNNAAFSLATPTSDEVEHPGPPFTAPGDDSLSSGHDYELGSGGAAFDGSWDGNEAFLDDTPELVKFVDDWSGISEKDALLISYGVPVAVPVGLDVYAAGTPPEETPDAAATELALGAVLRHLRFVEPRRALAVQLRYGLGGEPEHTVRDVGVRMGVSAMTASRYVRDGLGELRLRLALADVA